MSEQKPNRKPLSPQERSQVRYLLRSLAIILVFVIMAALIMGIVVTNLS